MAKKRDKSLMGLWAGVTFLIAGCTYPSVAGPVPYGCERASEPIVIDGRIDDVAWQAANVIANFYAFRPEGVTNLPSTEARILWDSKNLYVAITCMDADIWSYSDQADDDLWRGDVGEIFVKPDRDSSVYYEFVIAPNGTLYDGCYPSRGAGGGYRFKTWSSGARISSFVDGTDDDAADMDVGYTIEMAIPLGAFQGATPPSDGVTWTFGVFRYDFSKLFDEPLLLMSMPKSESKRGFHYYEGYADLVFKDACERGQK